MQNPKLAARYAKSLMDIALEQNKLDVIYGDMQGIHALCGGNADFVSLMKSPVIKADKKTSVTKAILEGKIDGVSYAFLTLIIQKGREYFLPEIAKAFIGLYKEYKKISEVVLTTAQPLEESMIQELQAKIQSQFQGMQIELQTCIDENLIGGFMLESN
ncbi:MAG TPA: ATP synthase F1 subunit delta, partial [Chitinophagaceae bacterium]|nr:ATP synthase F1 subunit delta [Chitinophagaceae bacterium]